MSGDFKRQLSTRNMLLDQKKKVEEVKSSDDSEEVKAEDVDNVDLTKGAGGLKASMSLIKVTGIS